MRHRQGLLGQPVRRGIRRDDEGRPPEFIKKVVKDDDFNDYSIKAVGKHATIKVNDSTMVDGDFEKMPEDGIIALQLHGGYPSMEVTFKNIQFKELKAEK